MALFGSVRHEPGTIIEFTYDAEQTVDTQKKVFVLHPEWRGKMHGLDLKRVSPAEVRVLQAIMDPTTKEAGHPYPLVNDILRRMDPIEEIKTPLNFYHKMVKPFVRDKDCYRQYWPNRMYNVRVVQPSQMEGKVVNPKPLFHK